MKQNTNESLSKTSASLDDIMNNVDQIDVTLKSREFITGLINDLRTKGMPNVKEWKLVDGRGNVHDMDSIKDTFDVDYTFEFTYQYNDMAIPLIMIITGYVDVDIEPYRPGNHFTPPEGGGASVDDRNLGSGLDLSLFHDGEELDISWVNAQLKNAITKEILRNYVS